MGNSLPPLFRIARWFVDRKRSRQRPPGILQCEACRANLLPGQGRWVEQYKAAVCGDDCAFMAQAERF